MRESAANSVSPRALFGRSGAETAGSAESTIPGYNPPEVGKYDPNSPRLQKLLGIRGTYATQDTPGADTAWKTFILNKSDGFTRPGVDRLNDSIRTYVWAILIAQGQTRTGILGDETAFDVQKQFLANVENAIKSPVDLQAAIINYQEALQYARSEVNYSFGKGLCMAPSDMLLRIGKIAGYNNKIIIATSAQHLGLNIGLNKVVTPLQPRRRQPKQITRPTRTKKQPWSEAVLPSA